MSGSSTKDKRGMRPKPTRSGSMDGPCCYKKPQKPATGKKSPKTSSKKSGY